MTSRQIVILGGGTGGTMVANRLRRRRDAGGSRHWRDGTALDRLAPGTPHTREEEGR